MPDEPNTNASSSTNQVVQPKPYAMEPNIAAVIAYIPFLGSIYVYSTEKENKFVRFHAVQAFIYWVCVIGGSGIINSLKFLFIGFFLDPLFQLAVIGSWFYLMLKAYRNEEYMLPIIGKIAKEQVYK